MLGDTAAPPLSLNKQSNKQAITQTIRQTDKQTNNQTCRELTKQAHRPCARPAYKAIQKQALVFVCFICLFVRLCNFYRLIITPPRIINYFCLPTVIYYLGGKKQLPPFDPLIINRTNLCHNNFIIKVCVVNVFLLKRKRPFIINHAKHGHCNLLLKLF